MVNHLLAVGLIILMFGIIYLLSIMPSLLVLMILVGVAYYALYKFVRTFRD